MLAFHHLLKTTFRGGHAVVHSDLTLDPSGTGFTAGHVGAQGHVVTLFFARR